MIIVNKVQINQIHNHISPCHTQADGDLVVPARRAKIEYTSALKLLSRPNRSWSPSVSSRITSGCWYFIAM